MKTTCVFFISALLAALALAFVATPAAAAERDPALVYRQAHAAALAAAASTSFESLLPHPDTVAAAIAADLKDTANTANTVNSPVSTLINTPVGSSNAVPETCLGCIELTSFIAPLAVSSVGIDILKALTFAYCFAKSIDCDGWLQCTELCSGIAETYVQEVADILAERQLSPVELCADIDICPAPPMPEPRPGIPVPSNLSDPTGQRTWPSWSTTTGTGAILHLSDIHLDTQYVAGTNTQCGLPLCCRAGNGQGTNASNTAGEFGDYNCDTPPSLFSSMLSFVSSSTSLTPDFVLYTGDDPAHDIWEQSQDANLDSMREVVQQLQQALTNVPVFHAVGNHEMYPVDQFLGPGGDSWLYSALAVSWSYYLPQDAIRTLRYGGYYQTLARPGLRVISLNTNVYASGDFYTEFTNRTDFSSQFAWLDDVLTQCAERGERAILIGHSEPRDWFTEFAETFRALLFNHSSTIMNVFFGHSHTAQLQVFHANTSATNGGTNFSEPFLTAFIGGSITPYTELNPGLVMYAYNRSNIATAPFLVTDFVQSYFDLPTANAKGSINWMETQHEALKLLGVPDLSPATLSKLAQGWLYEPTSNASVASFDNYMEYYYKGFVPADQQPGGYACDMLTVVDADDTTCDSTATSVLRAKLGRDPGPSTKPIGARCSAEHIKEAQEMSEKAAKAEAAKAEAAKTEAAENKPWFTLLKKLGLALA